MPSSHLILCRPLLFLPPPIPPSIRVFSNESTLPMRWPKYWSFSFNISPSNEHAGLISFRMDWLYHLAVQGTLKSLLQHAQSRTQLKRLRSSSSKKLIIELTSVQFSRSVVSDSLRPHELQHARPPCSPPTPRVHSNSRPSRQPCHPAISSSVIPFSSCPQSLPASESFPMSQLFV